MGSPWRSPLSVSYTHLAYEGAAVNRLTHSVNLMPMIEEALGRAGLDVSEIDLYLSLIHI